MKKTAPRKKKASSNNRNTETTTVDNWRKVGKGDRYRDRDARKPQEAEATLSKRSLQQPKSRLADLDEIWRETKLGQDFETLANVPSSAAGHFEFKSEKNWTLDVSKYDEYFSVDVENLATIIECIPYNQYVDVDRKYFTRDELTNINNTADRARKAYELMLESSRKDKLESDAGDCDPLSSSGTANDFLLDDPLKSHKADKQQDPNLQNVEEDLDFLLSLKEPVRPHPFSVGLPIKSGLGESKTKNIPAATKSIDLEKWLDLVLDD